MYNIFIYIQCTCLLLIICCDKGFNSGTSDFDLYQIRSRLWLMSAWYR